MKNNLEIYEKLCITPKEARKEIQAGRLKGMTDINPMWRIKSLTETFGVCGFGWKYVITSKRLETGCKGQISAFVDIDLFVKIDDKWSEAIQGTGGASFVTDEKNGLYQSDECFKMALTDAIGIACKALGMSADIYFNKDYSKYSQPKEEHKTEQKPVANEKQMAKLIERITSGESVDIEKLETVIQFTPEQKKIIEEAFNFK